MTEARTNTKGGRPRLAEGERRDTRFPDIRMTTAEREAAAEKAAAAGLSLSEFGRRAINGQRITARMSAADEAALRNLNRVGVNLAQIVKRLNMTGDVAEDAGEVLAEVRAAVERVARDGS